MTLHPLFETILSGIAPLVPTSVPAALRCPSCRVPLVAVLGGLSYSAGICPACERVPAHSGHRETSAPEREGRER